MIDSAQVISQIQDYVFENHPDLLDADDVIILMCLFSQWQQAYEGYLASHVLTYEASAQAFSDIYSSLNSDYARLKEFVRDNMEDLSAIAGFPIEDDRESILNLLPKLRKAMSKELASFEEDDWQELMFIIPKLS